MSLPLCPRWRNKMYLFIFWHLWTEDSQCRAPVVCPIQYCLCCLRWRGQYTLNWYFTALIPISPIWVTLIALSTNSCELARTRVVATWNCAQHFWTSYYINHYEIVFFLFAFLFHKSCINEVPLLIALFRLGAVLRVGCNCVVQSLRAV